MITKKDKNLAPIKSRIIKYIENQGIEKKTFFEKLQVASSNFRGNALFSEISAEVVAKILTLNYNISTEWLLTGKGVMLKTDTSNTEPLDTSEKEQYEEKIRLLENTLKDKEEIIKLLREQVDSLKKGDFDLFPLSMVAESKAEYLTSTQLTGEKTRKDYTKPHQ